MDSVDGLIIVLGWFLLRFGIPIIATVVVCYIFKNIDARWQAEGTAYLKSSGLDKLTSVIPCWVTNNCSEEKRAKCKAFQDQKIPCWQHFRSNNGELQEKCIGCGIFRTAPIPVIGD